jgi:hypothetical protein
MPKHTETYSLQETPLMAMPFEFNSQGAAMTAAMTLIGSSRKRYIVKQITNRFGFIRWIVVHPDGNPAIPFERFQA